jgi:hypothetical protein
VVEILHGSRGLRRVAHLNQSSVGLVEQDLDALDFTKGLDKHRHNHTR